jgi:hypothetical protein
MGADGRAVIVVDDEELVADTIDLILRSNGYEALALYDPKNRATRNDKRRPPRSWTLFMVCVANYTSPWKKGFPRTGCTGC